MWSFFKRKKEDIRDGSNADLSPQEAQTIYLVNESLNDFLDKINKLGGFDPMSISAVFAAINLISNGIAQMPWKVKTYKDDLVPDDLYLCHVTDHMVQTKFIFVKNLIKDVLIYGNGYAYIERDKSGVPIRLKYIPAEDCIVYYNQYKYYDDIYYYVPKFNRRYIEPINMVHVLMNSKDGILGKGILDFAKEAINLAGYTDKAAQEYFKNGMSVQGIIKSADKQRLRPDQREQIRQGWNSVEGSIRILEGGLDYQQVQSNSREAELTANRIFNVQEIARFFNINPVLLNDLSKMAYNTIEQANLEFVTHTLSPYIVGVEEELNRKLVLPKDKGKFYIDIDEESIIKSDKNSLSTYLGSLVDKGIITRNEARLKLGMPPLEGADILSVSYSDITQNTVAEGNTEEIFTENKTTIE